MTKPWQDAERLHELYHEQGLNQEEIGEELGCAKTTVSKWMRRLDVGATPRRPQSVPELADEAHLRRLYHEEELSLTDIADEIDSSAQTVRRWMARHGIERRGRGDAVALALRGGPAYFQTKPSGYEKWDVYDDGDRYTVPVHRLVAVAEIGPSPLRGDTVVHHENGIPWDNRPSNLVVMGRDEHSRLHRKQEEEADASQ